jgi:regulator of nonsense transcripts 2
MRAVDIPADSAIAVNSRSYQLQNKAEQEHLKRLVLQNERRQEQSEKTGECLVKDFLWRWSFHLGWES